VLEGPELGAAETLGDADGELEGPELNAAERLGDAEGELEGPVLGTAETLGDTDGQLEGAALGNVLGLSLGELLGLPLCDEMLLLSGTLTVAHSRWHTHGGTLRRVVNLMVVNSHSPKIRNIERDAVAV
jgi:hypothetical protein